MQKLKTAKELEAEWKKSPRWKGIIRPYKANDIIRLRGTLQIDHTLARHGAEKLWHLFKKERAVRALGAMTGSQAVQQVEAGLKAIYLSGWQVAGDMNDTLQTYPDQSLYTWMSVPNLIRRLNNALMRADQIQHLNRSGKLDYFAPIIADAEAGFGGPLNTFELIKAMICEGVAAIHLEDQLSSLKKCGHMGGKVLVPVAEFIEKLITARLAADVLDVPTLIIGRTDAEAATLIRSDADPIDRRFLTGKRSQEGFYYVKSGTKYAVERALAFAPYCDMVWCETSKPDLKEAEEFAKGIHSKYPDKWLAYNCSPSFNWKAHLSDKAISSFQEKLADMGYKFQFVTLAGFHAINASMFELAYTYGKKGMKAYADFQEHEFSLQDHHGYTAVKHQSFVGAGYFDRIQELIMGEESSTKSLSGSTEEKQFKK